MVSIMDNKVKKEFDTKKALLFATPIIVLSALAWGMLGYRASQTALLHANLSRDDVSYIRIQFDLDDMIPQYEVSWYENSRQVEYVVHAFDGQILEIDYDM